MASKVATNVTEGFNKFADGFRNTISNLKNITLADDDLFWFNVALAVMLGLLFLLIIYLVVSYQVMRSKLFDLNDFVNKSRRLGRLYGSKPFDPKLFETILLDALDVLRTNVNIIAAPYYYAKSLDEMLIAVPSYIKVMRFAKYVYDHPDTKNDEIHKILKAKYGKRYGKSPQIQFDITYQMGPYPRTHQHSILVDLSRSQYVYKKNYTRANKLIASVEAELSTKK